MKMDAGTNGAETVKEIMPQSIVTPLSVGNYLFKSYLPDKTNSLRKATDKTLEVGQKSLTRAGNDLVEVSFQGSPYTIPSLGFASLAYAGASIASFLRIGTADKKEIPEIGKSLSKDILLLPMNRKLGNEIIQLLNYSCDKEIN